MLIKRSSIANYSRRLQGILDEQINWKLFKRRVMIMLMSLMKKLKNQTMVKSIMRSIKNMITDRSSKKMVMMLKSTDQSLREMPTT